MDKEKLFSQEALNKLRSPEKLNTLIPVTNPVAWMGLAAVCMLMFAVVFWSVFGAFTERANGMGLIMDFAGVVTVSHTVPTLPQATATLSAGSINTTPNFINRTQAKIFIPNMTALLTKS